MKQSRLNDLLIFSAYKNQLDLIDLIERAHLLIKMSAGDVLLECSSFRYFYFVLISFMSNFFISQFFPLKISSFFSLNEHSFL